jgi:DNA-binding NarL/FixJ family response regulator
MIDVGVQMRVLIADNSTALSERLADHLGELAGVEIVGQAKDAAAARDLSARLKPDLTVLDTLDSRGDWIDLLQDLKRNSPGSKVIMLTNFVEAENREMCERNGADYFFDKSIEFDQAVAVIRGMQRRAS